MCYRCVYTLAIIFFLQSRLKNSSSTTIQKRIDQKYSKTAIMWHFKILLNYLNSSFILVIKFVLIIILTIIIIITIKYNTLFI